jgi:glycosyltransferase involved in cell wall biosynthesis
MVVAAGRRVPTDSGRCHLRAQDRNDLDGTPHGIVGRMRVARIITRLNIGGPAIQAINLSSRLSAFGIETLLIHGSVADAEGDMDYLLERADPQPSTLHVLDLQRRMMPLKDARAWWSIFRALCRFRPHIVHTHMAKAGALGRLATIAYNRTVGRRRPARMVHTYHGHVLEGYFGAAATAAFVGIERRLAAATDCLIAVSPRVRDSLVIQHRIGNPEQYRIVPLGFELEQFSAIDDEDRMRARVQLHISKHACVITTVGRLTPIKDHATFLETAARIAHEVPTALFLIAGDGELRALLEAHTSALGIRDRVHFLGWRRDLDILYAATDVFVLSSLNEGTPVALIESLAAGCPAVSTDVGGVRDVISSPAVGLLAPAGDAAALAKCTIELIASRDRRRAMGEAGRRSALERYSVERLLGDIVALYEALLDPLRANAGSATADLRSQ